MTHNNPKPFKPKQDRYEKMNKTTMLLRESSFMGNSVQTMVSLSPDVLVEQVKQCRICLHEEDPLGMKELYSVCKCTGSVQYLHEQCFASWVNRSFDQKPIQQRKKILQQGSECQLCKQLIPIQIKTLTQCASHKLIKHRIIKKPFLFTIFTTIEIISLVMISFVLGMMGTLEVGFSQQKIVNTVVLIGSLVVLLSLALGVGYSFVNDFFLQVKVIIVGFGDSVRGKGKQNQHTQTINQKNNNNKKTITITNNLSRQDSFMTSSVNTQQHQTNQINSLQQINQQHINLSIYPINQQQSRENVLHVTSSLQQLEP